MTDQPPASGQTNTDAGEKSLLASAAETSDKGIAQESKGVPSAETKQDAAPADKAADKSADKPADTAPEKYEFKLPDGQTMDAKVLESVTPIFKELKLSNEQAQKLVDFEAARVKAQADEWSKQINDWQSQIKSDPKWQENIALAKKAIAYAGDKETASLLEGPYIGNNPKLVSFLAKVGKLVSEAPVIEGKGAGGDNPRSAADVLYGDMFKK